MRQFKESTFFAMILHLLFPGWGYVFWREYTFGLFVFLIMLIASALFFVSFLVAIPSGVVWLLLGLPTVFFLFSFFDLARSTRKRQGKMRHTTVSTGLFLFVAVGYQLLAPNTPANFLLRNAPEVFLMGHNQLGPVYDQGDILLTNRMAYSVNLFFFDRPVYHALPDYFDVVRFDDDRGHRVSGLVVGLPGELVEIQGGELIVDGRPESFRPRQQWMIGGDWPLTLTSENSILVATMYLGTIDSVHQVPLTSLIGKVGRLL